MITRLLLSNVLTVDGLPPRLARAAVGDVTLPNPEFVRRNKLGLWTGETSATVTLARQRGDTLILPRGCAERLVARLEAAGLEYAVIPSNEM
jgi:hypothetical protein